MPGIGVIMIDGEYTVESALRAIEAEGVATGQGGSAVTEYPSRWRNQVKLERQTTPATRKLGPMVRIYDPELAIILGGE